MTRKILPALLFFIVMTAGAQPQKKNKFYVLPQIGLLNGDHHVNGQVGLSAGMQHKMFSFGIGASIDYYKMRTIPLFAEMRAKLLRNKNAFAYLNAGPNFIWPLESQYAYHWNLDNGMERDRYTTAFYGETGLCYLFPLARNGDLLLGFGYSLKTIHQSYYERINAGTRTENVLRRLDYSLNRLSLRVGVLL